MPNACPFSTFELISAEVYVAALRTVLLRGECHLPNASEISTIPTLMAMLQVYPSFLWTATSQEKRIRTEDLVAQAKSYKRWQTDNYKWPAISPLNTLEPPSKSPSLSRSPASSYSHLDGSSAATDLSFRTRADNLHVIFQSRLKDRIGVNIWTGFLVSSACSYLP
jgi:hypothetical protein